ncbi:MAG TPA: Spy/CpxP family protein refolding chaperone [Chryseosolibacter sp.]
MKKSMIVLSALMIMGSAVFAQTTEKQRQHGEGHLEKLKSELALTDAQYGSIKSINQKYRAEFSELRRDSLQERTQKHLALQKLRDDRKKEIDAVLSAEQKTKLEVLQKARVEQRRKIMRSRTEKRQEIMIKELSLNDDQAKKVTDANRLLIEKLSAIREKSGNKDELKKARQEHEATIQSILTDEQFNTWKTIRKSMKEKHRHDSRKHKQN